MGIKKLNQLGEVGKRPRQPIYFVDDDNVDLAGANVIEQPLEVRPVATGAQNVAMRALANKLVRI